MRYILIFWALPLGLFWSWYLLSANNISFGFLMLSREAHDLVFTIYGNVLGIEPAAIPLLVAQACVFDTLIVFAIFAYRRRRAIREWMTGRRERYLGGAARNA